MYISYIVTMMMIVMMIKYTHAVKLARRLSKVLFCSFLIVSRSFSQRSSSVINLVRAQKKE